MDNLQNICKHNTFFKLDSNERRIVIENIVYWDQYMEAMKYITTR